MKNIINIAFLFSLLFFSTSHADTFKIGKKEINIPSPQGFSPVTEKMSEIQKLNQQTVDPANDQLAYYIRDSEIATALAGKLPDLERYFILKVSKKLKSMTVSTKNFEQFKGATKKQNKTLMKSIEAQAAKSLKETSKNISEALGVDVAISLSKVVPLGVHNESENTLSYSMYINYGKPEGNKEDIVIATTVTYININGKIIFLYNYAKKDDIEWTRSASKAWMKKILSNNVLDNTHPQTLTKAETKSSSSTGLDWGEVLKNTMIGAVIGGLAALVGLLLRRRKKNATNEKNDKT